MPSNFIFFVVFATVTQGVFVPSSAASGEPSDEAPTIPNQIKSNQMAAASSAKDAAKSFFDTLMKQIIDNTTSTDQDFSAQLKEGLSKAKDSINYTLISISLVLGEPCAAIEVTRNTLYADLENIFSVIEDAIQSAKTGDYPKNQAIIDNYEAKSRISFASLSVNMFNATRSCLNPGSRPEIEAVIQKAADGTRTHFDNINVGAYAAVKIYAALTSDKNLYDREYVLVFLESRLLDVWHGILGHEAYYFGLLQALYIDNYLGGTKIVHYLYLILSNLQISSNDFTEAAEIVNAIVVNFLEKKTSVNEDDRANHYPRRNVDFNKAIEILQKGTVIYYNTVCDTQPMSAEKVEAFRLVSSGPTVITIDSYSVSLNLVNDGLLCSATPLAIQGINATQNVASAVVIEGITNVVSGNNLSTLIENIAIIEKLREKATSNVFVTNNNIHGGIILVAEIICLEKGATQLDYVKIRTFENTAVSALDRFVNNMYCMDLIEVLADAGYSPELYLQPELLLCL